MGNTKKLFSANSDYQKFVVLKTNRNKRYRYNQFFVEGVRNINEAIKNGWHISSFIYNGEAALSDWASKLLNEVKTEINYELTAVLTASLSGKEDTSELMAVVEMCDDNLDSIDLSELPLIALFDRPSNRGNLGTIIRSCDSLGVEALIITGHSVDLYDPEVITASMGSFFNVKTARVNDNNQLNDYIKMLKITYPNFTVVGTTAHHELPIYNMNLNIPLLFMIGNETDGLCMGFKQSCDILATIPMAPDSSASSFNVACAASIMFYEAARQRKANK